MAGAALKADCWWYSVLALNLRIWFAFVGATLAAYAQPVVAVKIDGVVHPITAEIVGRAIEQARQQNAEALLVRLNTPGGLVDATREIVEKLVASPVAVITYVEPSGGRAASAGFFILEAGDVAAMAPATNTGASTPVALTGGQIDAVLRNKINNDAAAWMRSVVGKRGRNVALAEKTVLEAKSYTDKEALEGHLIEFIASNEADLFRQLNGREIIRFDGRKQTLHFTAARVVDYEPNLRERIMSAIADPNIALILLVIGALGIYVEFSTPGMIAPGVFGAICVLLGLSALSVVPINWGAAALIVASLVMFVLEAKFATHGVLTVGGTLAMILGALLLVNSPLPELRIHPATAISVAVPFALVTSFLLTLAIRARRNKVMTGAAGMVGETGVAHTELAPAGMVFIHGEYWNAVSSAPVASGAQVVVTSVEGLTLKVEPAPKGAGGIHG